MHRTTVFLRALHTDLFYGSIWMLVCVIPILSFLVIFILWTIRKRIMRQRIGEYNAKSINNWERKPVNPCENFNWIFYDCPQVGENTPKKKKGNKKGAQVKISMKDHIIAIEN
ncbi:uncharacterized protein [Palaemon carinicauda]|uniref:uncharacterized protein isoform X2 n=1 Tax=Palaemon carinicauda TaxID=392227 RepID=UPI0035B5A087